MRKTLIATGLLLGMSSSVSALNIDFGGTGSVGASEFFNSISWDTGNALVEGAVSNVGAGSTAATVYLQASYSFGAGVTDIMTYQLVLPVTATRVTGVLGADSFVSTTYVVDGARASSFAMFLDPTPMTSDSTGLGFGNLNSGALDTDQVLIASGNVFNIDVSGFSMQTNLTKTTTSPIDKGGDGIVNGNDGILNGVFVESQQITGSTSLNINIDYRDPLYVVSELNDITIDVNLTVQDVAFNAPFPNIEASDSVVNRAAFFGDSTNRLNSLQNCVSDPFGSNSNCDVQLQLGSNSQFFDPRVPEPASLGITGLGLVLLGFAGRKRRKA